MPFNFLTTIGILHFLSNHNENWLRLNTEEGKLEEKLYCRKPFLIHVPVSKKKVWIEKSLEGK